MNGYGRGEDNQKKDKVSIVTRETGGMTLLLFSALLLLITVTRSLMLGDVGIAITAFFLGLMGYMTYPVLVLLIYVSLVMITGKKMLPVKWVVLPYLLLCAIFLVVHLATGAAFMGDTYGAYLGACWKAGEGGVATSTGGGVLFGLLVFPVQQLLSVAGAYVVFSFLIVLALFFMLRATPARKYLSFKTYRKREVPQKSSEQRDNVRAYPAPVAFDDLPPARTAAPYVGQEEPRQVYTAPVRQGYAEPKANARDAGRSILFSDPATSYKNNLIFDRDSYFNSRTLRSSVTQNVPSAQSTAQSAASAPVQNVQPSVTAPQSYQSDYLRQTEISRPAMPKRISEEKPFAEGGYSYPLRSDEDINYPVRPTYRAQEAAPAEQKHNFYANDVPYEEEFSSAPNVDDLPTTEERPVLSAEVPREEKPIVPPVRPVVPAQEENDRARDGGILGNYFSRRAERSSRFDRERSEPLAEQTPAEETFEEPSSRGELPKEEPVIRRRVNPLNLEQPEDELPESRVFDAPVRGRESAANLFDDEPLAEEPAETVPAIEEVRSRGLGLGGERGGRQSLFRERAAEQTPAAATPVPVEEAPVPQRHVYKEYIHPSIELFRQYDDTASVSQEEIERNSAIIVETLAAFRVDAEVIKVTCGSSVTRYDIDIPRNISVTSVVKRDKEIAMRLHARDGVNVYSNWEHGAISIEVPNSKRATVGMKSVMQSEAFTNAKPTSLTFVIGKDIEGRSVCGDVDKMTHILIAGSTGSGKSVCLHAMLISLICKYSPEDLRLILIDPKKVEFAVYEGIPHLMINEIITDAQKVVTALNWAVKEMERRYKLFEDKTHAGTPVRKIDDYNAALTEDEEKLPKIIIVVDELADLMAVAKKDIEERINRLAAKARAAGIHLVIATQRPSVDVVTGVIKSNLPTRMALRVIQEVDSRTILDESGAEKLLGNGDMLFSIGGMNKTRAQGAFIGNDETQAVISFIKQNNEAYFDTSVADYINKTEQSEGGSFGGGDDGDEAVSSEYIKALGIVVKLGSASISLIQRKCSVGYNHAGKIIEWMEVMGYISPFDGKAKARTVLLTPEEYESKYGGLDE